MYSLNLLWKKIEILDEFDLSLLLKMVNDNEKQNKDFLHWNIIASLKEDMQDIIKTSKWLKECFNQLNENNTIFLLITIKNKLKDIIKDSYTLSELLSKISEENNKIIFLKMFRFRWLENIVVNAKDLSNIFEFLFEEQSQYYFIKLLWDKYIREIFLRTNEIVIILHLLSETNKILLINILTLKWLKHKITSSETFLKLYRWIPNSFVNDFLNMFNDQEFINIFKNIDIYTFLLRLPENKTNEFLLYYNENTRLLQA